jgi:integrase
MATAPARRRRTRGEIETLPSGSLRVRVYAGLDPLTKRRHYLAETIPAGPGAAREAEKARTRLLAEVDQQRNPRTRATVNQLLDRYLELLDVGETTRRAYESNIRTHIRPLLGTMPLARLNGEVLDVFYATLRRCREHCDGRRRAGHACKPLAASAVRKNHTILSGACERAVKWRWLGVNPTKQASAPPLAPANPQPPTAEEAAAILNEAWKDPDWGMFVWLAMVTGARRGELCALAWDRVDLDAGVLVIRTSIAQRRGRTREKETKTHQQRRLALDEQDRRSTVGVPGPVPGTGRVARPRAAGGRADLLARPGREHLAEARLDDPAVRADVRPARLGHAPPPAPALLRDPRRS